MSEKNPIQKEPHMCFIFHKLAGFFSMVDVTVVKHKHAAWSRVWVGEWQLRFCPNHQTIAMYHKLMQELYKLLTCH